MQTLLLLLYEDELSLRLNENHLQVSLSRDYICSVHHQLFSFIKTSLLVAKLEYYILLNKAGDDYHDIVLI